MEIVSTDPMVLVDFAHTPDALENVLSNLSSLVSGRIILVFGCGGDRDAGKRPLMGKVASDLADYLILTNDNPRHEDPMSILKAIQTGISSEKAVELIPERQAAIGRAMELAQAEDVILIAGKGHETYQQIGQIKHHFSDQEVVRAYRKS
jgi:UDP-N-acetylmuramoyl-L-alanyl-D-glutamate--2,6-diaminopimelate ligase